MPTDLKLRFPYRMPQPSATMRLFCFACAGSGASQFRSWQAPLLREEIEVCSFQYPGREARFGEPPIDSIAGLARDALDAIAALSDRPFCFLGHSMGAFVAFELTRQLEQRGLATPRMLYLLGQRPPHIVLDEQLVHELPDAAFREELGKLGATPLEILANEELMELLTPMLRADFKAGETYPSPEQPEIGADIIAVGGREDPWVDHADLARWKQLSRGTTRAVTVDGGHFFPVERPQSVFEIIATTVQSMTRR